MSPLLAQTSRFDERESPSSHFPVLVRRRPISFWHGAARLFLAQDEGRSTLDCYATVWINPQCATTTSRQVFIAELVPHL